MNKSLYGSSTEIFCATQETISPKIRLA